YWYSYKLGVAQLEERLTEHMEKEDKYIEKIRTLEFFYEGKVKYVETLKKELETLKEEKDVVDGKPSPTVESTSAEGDRPAERPTTNKAEFVKAAERPTTDKVEIAKKPAVRYAEMYRRTSKRPAGHRPYSPPMRPMRSNINSARPKRTSAVRPQYRAPWVPTVNRNFPPVNRKLPTGNSEVKKKQRNKKLEDSE
nr:hypothetical protein [Tanacetum cinerariifolium]